MYMVELFAGAGGLLEGFMKAGFKSVACVEKNEDACSTLRTRHAFWNLKNNDRLSIYYDYLKKNISRDELWNCAGDDPVINLEITADALNTVEREIRKRMSDAGIKKIDVFTGGPPCQTFSVAGRRRRGNDISCDSRTHLYVYYAELLRRFKPEIFVFENVTGILSAKLGGEYAIDKIRKEFFSAGYLFDFRILNAADLGVLQNRKRVIMIGWKKRKKMNYPDFCRFSYGEYRVSDLLSDLPEILHDRNPNNLKYISEPATYLLKSGIREKDFDILTWHVARKLNDNDRKIYRMAIEKWNAEKDRLKYSKLPDCLKTHRNRESFEDRFKVVAGDLPYSHTLVAHIARDGHYYIHPDINQNRSITVREAARIQSFPDDYFFDGSRTSAFMQIGNAVPPVMAYRIAERIKEIL